METSYLIKLALSFLVGGIWVAFSSIVSEKFGSKVGGVISGIPTTIAVALLFIGILQGTESASAATTIVPASFAINCLFMVAYAASLRLGLLCALTISFLVWFSCQLALVWSKFNHFGLSLLLCIIALSSAIIIFERGLAVRSHGKVKIQYTVRQISVRAFGAGSVVAFAVLMGRVGGPVWAGIFASFPAMFASTLVVTYLSVGPEFSRSISKTLMISGVINCVVYATAVRFLYPALGLAFGTIVASIIALCSGYLTLLLVRRITT